MMDYAFSIVNIIHNLIEQFSIIFFLGNSFHQQLRFFLSNCLHLLACDILLKTSQHYLKLQNDCVYIDCVKSNVHGTSKAT